MNSRACGCRNYNQHADMKVLPKWTYLVILASECSNLFLCGDVFLLFYTGTPPTLPGFQFTRLECNCSQYGSWPKHSLHMLFVRNGRTVSWIYWEWFLIFEFFQQNTLCLTLCFVGGSLLLLEVVLRLIGIFRIGLGRDNR